MSEKIECPYCLSGNDKHNSNCCRCGAPLDNGDLRKPENNIASKPKYDICPNCLKRTLLKKHCQHCRMPIDNDGTFLWVDLSKNTIQRQVDDGKKIKELLFGKIKWLFGRERV